MAPTVLVLGGVGFIGRTFVAYLVDNNLASSIRVVDKVLPATAYLSESHKKVFTDPRVEFKQANLVNACISD
jgi:dTDP-D-glucose 4,6-dehydratase